MQPLRLLREICSIPTAPFLEGRVIDYVQRFVARRPALKLRRDAAGNLLIELRGRRPALPRWVFAAHMDHPGFVSRRMLDSRTLEADFRGSVRAEFVRGAAVRFFADDRQIAGRIIHVESEPDAPWARRARIRVSREVPADCIGMFDQGEGRIRGRRFHCRVCDNLAGVAAALAMLQRLGRAAVDATIAVLLTRAEEEGFIGALAACQRPRLLRRSDRLIVIEASAAQPYAPLGAGPIIRVGDRTSIFNSSLTWFLSQQAQSLAARRKGFLWQRALMGGGTCEATVYDLYGYRAASVCVALGNYHNMDVQRRRIGAEFIDVDDWLGMVELFVAIARAAAEYRPDHSPLRRRLEERFERLRHLL